MGRVFRARHMKMQRDVALKVLSERLLGDPVAVRRFRREVELLGQLSHANIVAAFDAREEGGLFCLVTEYVQGSDLFTMVCKGGALPVATAVEFLAQAAQGLAYAHSRGIIHRDIKPSNLFVDHHGTLKVLDLGLARIVHAPGEIDETQTQLTSLGSVIGTVNYIAPEQILDMSAADERADIYSLGCTLHFLLTGVAPVPEGSRSQKLDWHLGDQRPPLSRSRPDVPEGLDRIYQKMTARDPDRRYANMHQLLDALTQFAPGPSGAQLPPPTTEWKHSGSPDSTTFADREFTSIDDTARTGEGTPRPGLGWKRPAAITLAVVLLVVAVVAIAKRYGKDGPPPPVSRQSAMSGKSKTAMTEKVEMTRMAGARPRPAKLPFPMALPDVSNSLGMKFARIPAGTFKMGAPQTEAGSLDAERPQQTVQITRPFLLGRHEVTQKQYARVMGANPSHFSAKGQGAAAVKDRNTDDHPVENVTFLEAREFCKRLAALPAEVKAGRSYRLPTEVEWEYACRAGTRTVFAFGDSLSSKQANFNGKRPYGDAPQGFMWRSTRPLGSYDPNAWGLFDMHGNVAEWCETIYGPYPGGEQAVQQQRERMVQRGGAAMFPATECRSAARSFREPDMRSQYVGFRVVCEEMKMKDER
jgi:formylglycine-generating enzyme required for sulfatase activity/serine/threonine protein kinase